MRTHLNNFFTWIILFLGVFLIMINNTEEIEISEMNIQLLGKHVLQMIKNNLTLEDNTFQKAKQLLVKNVNIGVLHNYLHKNLTNNCLWNNQNTSLKNNLKELESKYYKIESCFNSYECLSKNIKMILKSICTFVKEKIYHKFRNVSLNNDKCTKIQSLNEEIHGIYNLVLLTLIKGHTILMTKISGIDRKKKYSILLRRYNKRALSLKAETKNILRYSLPREIRQRDPAIHVERVTYGRLKQFIQGYVTGEQYLNKFSSCTSKCSDYRSTKHHNQSSFFTLESNLKCHGTIYDCKKSSIDKICLQPHSKGNDRRYVGFTYHFGPTRKHCSIKSNQKNVTKIIAFNAVETGILPYARYTQGECELCECYCDDIKKVTSIRFFSLKEVQSNINENYVITGIRFRIVNQVVWLQIQQGKLMNTIIDPMTVHWQSVDLPKLQNNNDIVRLDYHKRSLNLDDIEVPPGAIVIGVKFKMVNDRLTLMVSGGKIYKNKFINSSPIWYPKEFNDEERKELDINNLDVPTSSSYDNEILSEPNEYYVKFTTTNWITDAAQTIVPFIDLQPVTTDPPSPVGGVGIYHKRKKIDGGFIAPKLLSVDYSSII